MRIPGLKLDGALDELPWRSTREPGIAWIDLGAEPGVDAMTVLIRMNPGCGYPRHRHLGAEDVLVLAGGYEDDDGRRCVAGDFVRYSAGSSHAPCALGDAGSPAGEDNPACILFAVAHGGTERVEPEGER
ncbi:MAG: cupin domain-containing protein [Planctomycetota bacterium]